MRHTIVNQVICKAFILVCKVFSIFGKVKSLNNQTATMLSKITMNNHSFIILIIVLEYLYCVFYILPTYVINLLFKRKMVKINNLLLLRHPLSLPHNGALHLPQQQHLLEKSKGCLSRQLLESIVPKFLQTYISSYHLIYGSTATLITPSNLFSNRWYASAMSASL